MLTHRSLRYSEHVKNQNNTIFATEPQYESNKLLNSTTLMSHRQHK